MTTCPKCRTPYPDDIKTCPKDGTSLDRPRTRQIPPKGATPGPQGEVIAFPSAESAPQQGSRDALAPGTEVGSYRIVQLLGEGGMGQVYLAEHMRLGRRVAMKTLRTQYSSHPEAVRRFFREARSVNQINHQHIIEITDFVENPDGISYCIMELLEGENVGDVLVREKILTAPRTARICVQVAEALAAAHEAGVIHRDLKTENIFLTERDGRGEFVKLLDFGIAKLIDAEESQLVGKTAAGAILGTPEYMSPEQAAGKPVDGRADIYSLGVILYEMVTGGRPFSGLSFGEVMVKHLTIEPRRPSRVRQTPGGLPQAFENLIMQCLEKDPVRRPQTMREIAGRLKVFAEADPASLPLATGRGPAPDIAVVIGLILLIIAAAAVIGHFAFRPGPPRPAEVPVILPPQEPEKRPAQAAHVEISFSSTPPGAQVLREGGDRPIGVTPFTALLDRAAARETMTFRMEGYREVRQEVDLGRDGAISVVFVKTSEHGKKAAPQDGAKTGVKGQKPAGDDQKAGGDGAKSKERKLDPRGVVDPFND